MTVFGTIERAVADIAAGRPVVVVDDPARENEGDLIFAAERATPELLAFMVRHTSGYICAPITEADADRLGLPPMCAVNEDPRGTAYTVTVDARDGVGTGISAADRARTIRLLADPWTRPADLTRPGHVVPLRARAGGVLARPGHTEASVDLAALAGLRPAAVLCELVNDDGTMMRLPDLVPFAAAHGLALITIADLVAYLRRAERAAERAVEPVVARAVEPVVARMVEPVVARMVEPVVEAVVERVVEARLPTPHGAFRAVGYRAAADGGEHLAFVYGDLADGRDVLVRVHSECLTGDVFGSLRCDCGPQLQAGLARVAAEGRGVVVYLRGHEGRGIGLLHKLRAYRLQDHGRDTVDANLDLGLPADARDYGAGALILRDLGVRSLRLLTNNPAKRAGLEAYGLSVTALAGLPVRPHPENVRYLRTKRDRMGHLLGRLDTGPGVAVEGA